MEDTMLDLLEDCRQKELYCIHNNVDDLIESALNPKLLLINLNSQRFDKENQEVKNIALDRATKFNAITHDLPTEEPEYSLSMGDKHLDTISETESDKVIKSSVDNLVPIPSESEDFSDNETSPPDSELVSLEEVNNVDQKKEEIDLEDTLRIQDIILREKLLNINCLIANIKSLNDNPTPDRVLKSPSSFSIPVADNDSFFEEFDTFLSYSVNSLPEFETFRYHTEETSSGSTTTHANNSLPEYDSFHFEIEPDQGGLTSVIMDDIFGEPRVHMLNILPTLDSDFTPSDYSLGSGLEVSFPFESINKIFDPGIFIEVQSDRLLSRDAFGILSSPFLSHRDKIIFDFSKSPMMISGGDIPLLDVPYLHFYPP
ncbi:hypothetical protein Tco_1145253 [Tanacetum coccineum]